MRDRPLSEVSDGVLLYFKLTPNARKNEVLGVVEGTDGPVIAAKVRAIPDKGKANKALIALVSQWLGVAKTTIELKSGGKSRRKTLTISGDSGELAQMTEALIERKA